MAGEENEAFRGAEEIRAAYEDADVARTYVDRRFREPLGALLHARQAGCLKAILRSHRPRRVLEIAPGPARLTVEVASLVEGGGTAVDTSAEMLAVARRRLGPEAAGRWAFVRGDAFSLPLRTASFDLAYTFRLIRHFEERDRARLYVELARILRPGGLLVFDAVNEAVSASLRACARPGEYAHYDALLRPEAVQAEAARAGFETLSLLPVQRRYALLHRIQVLVAPRSRMLARAAMELVDRLGGEPLEWIVTCRRA